jgi:oxygen-dependent protoporphyrinogen oxidase
VVLRAHVGRSDDERWSTLDDVELSSRVTQELAVLLSQFSAPNETFVQRWRPGLPQYFVGHERLVASARAAAAVRHLALAGNSYDGVGVPASVGSGRRAAREILDGLN